MVGMKAIRDIRVKCQKHVGFRGSNLGDELVAQLETFDQLGVRVTQKHDTLDSQHISGKLLLALANLRHLGSRLGRVARALVARGRQDEIDDHSTAGHHQHDAGAIELDVVRVRDDAERPPDPFVIGSGE